MSLRHFSKTNLRLTSFQRLLSGERFSLAFFGRNITTHWRLSVAKFQVCIRHLFIHLMILKRNLIVYQMIGLLLCNQIGLCAWFGYRSFPTCGHLILWKFLGPFRLRLLVRVTLYITIILETISIGIKCVYWCIHRAHKSLILISIFWHISYDATSRNFRQLINFKLGRNERTLVRNCSTGFKRIRLYRESVLIWWLLRVLTAERVCSFGRVSSTCWIWTQWLLSPSCLFIFWNVNQLLSLFYPLFNFLLLLLLSLLNVNALIKWIWF